MSAGPWCGAGSVRRAQPSAPPVAMPPLAFAAGAALLASLLAASAGIPDDAVVAASEVNKRSIKSIGQGSIAGGCLYEGAWHREGGSVPSGEACLRCACRLGALACRRRACAPLPDPPPRRCHVLHRKGSCCPELHCPDGVILMEQGASARLESDEDIVGPSSITHACVEGGSVYAAGSAMRSPLPCEQCFCLGGARRCVRPRCLPPPPGCRPRAPRGACCPQRYYCDHATDTPPDEKHTHDCKVDNKWVPEGERVVPTASAGNCTQCYCLRGAVQCQPLSCALPLLGCTPLLRPGECCAHQYHCEHNQHGSQILTLSSNALTSIRNDDRAFHTSKSNKHETATKNTLSNIHTSSNAPNLTATENHLISTTKVKRKTSDPPSEISSLSSVKSTTVMPTSTMTTTLVSTTSAELISTTMAKLMTTTEATLPTSQSTTSFSTTDFTTETTSTEQPEESVKIMINGTINCTAELSSTSLPLNMTFNDTEKNYQESHPRVPLIDVGNLEDHTFSANDIITDRTVNGVFDENESFVINVTSSLNANTNHSHTVTKPPLHRLSTVSMSVPTSSVENNSSKKTKGDYDFDYTEPTLPPSLPNLKIIPFVAADAVLEDDHPKETLTYPILEREDKFPVYYPSIDTKDTAYVTRREEVYRPTQYPVFITDKPDHEQYPSLTSDVDLTHIGYSNFHTDMDTSGNEYTVSSSLGNRVSDVKSATQSPLATTTFKLKAPAVNLFSPPVETEGGFVPKGPTGLIDEYFAVFPSTPPGPAVPYLTTSMQLDIMKGECVSRDGRHVPEGESITLACSECTCAWGELHCSPQPCPTPASCTRRPISNKSADLCCGELICDEDNKTTRAPEVSTARLETTDLKLITESFTESNHFNKKHQETTINNTVNIDIPSKKVDNISQSYVTTFNSTKNQIVKNENITRISTTTEKLFNKSVTMTTAAPFYQSTQNNNESPEYEEEDEEGEEEGVGNISFGTVLKLLLSDNYETTTTPPKRIPTTTRSANVKTTTTIRRPRPTLPPVLPPKPTISPFVPLPNYPYVPSKANQNTINRIDHLVLGEATSIKKTTSRPISSTFWPTATNRPTTPRIAMKPTELTIEEGYSTQDAPRPSGGIPGLGPGLLKLAGCNIYGRMYRVGRIITELSTPCEECWCTELGVQCKQLKC